MSGARQFQGAYQDSEKENQNARSETHMQTRPVAGEKRLVLYEPRKRGL